MCPAIRSGTRTAAGRRVTFASLIVGLILVSVSALSAATASAARTPLASSLPLLATLSDPGAIANSYFGGALAVDKTTGVVSAGGATSNAGAVYIYLKHRGRWMTTPSVTLSAPSTTGVRFGSSVAISGATIVVGAGGSQPEAGAAYIYQKSGSVWPTTPTVTLSNPASVYDDFGSSVAVSGTTVVVGAYDLDTGVGAAYIYQKSGSVWPTTPTATLINLRTGDGFGHSVSVFGTAVVVGAYGISAGAGAAYIYEKSRSEWPATPTVTLSNPASTPSGFGESVSLSGGTLVVGADGSTGAAYIY